MIIFMNDNKDSPNIVVILTDDQGAWAMGCAGNTEVQTPNLDRLAESGVRFENFFCTSPVCSPSRASLLTGKMPSQHGIHDWLQHTDEHQTNLEYLEGQIGYTDILAANGYTCGITGKWHMGNSYLPQKGFSHWYVHAQGGGPYYNAPMIRNGKLVHEPEYITDVITDEGISFMEEQVAENKPFYLNISYTAPHSPWIDQHPQKYLDMYEDCAFEETPKTKEHPWSTTDYRENHHENLKGYYASITAMDDNVGKVLDKLEELKIRENTIVWFMSDNGFSFGQNGIWGKGNATFPQNMYDNSVKVPAIVSHPGKIKAGDLCEDLISGYDFMPTLLDYVGHGDKVPKGLPGTSFVPLLNNTKSESDNHEHVVVYDEYGPVRMIRTKEWKYVHRYPYGPHELYDLVADPKELINLIDKAEHNKVIIELRSKLESWFVENSNSSIDGVKEAVTGAGQVDLAGTKRTKRKSYSEWEELEDIL